MTRYLWANRERPPLLSRPWLEAWAKRALTLPSLLRSSWRINRLRDKRAQIGEGAFISRADISGTLSLFSVGLGSFIGRVTIQVHERVSVGSYVCINDGVIILSASHNVRSPEWELHAKPVVIQDYVWIATGAIILPGVTIGRGAVVGAGAVVARDLPPLAVAAGNPAVVRENQRCSEFNYSPVGLVAAYSAWLGKSPNYKTIEASEGPAVPTG